MFGRKKDKKAEKCSCKKGKNVEASTESTKSCSSKMTDSCKTKNCK